MLLPVATVLLIERRTCSCCGTIHEVPSTHLHELHLSCRGYERASAIVPLKEKESLHSNLKVRIVHETMVPLCQDCFVENVDIEVLEFMRPEAPPPAFKYPTEGTEPQPIVKIPALEDL